MRLSMTMPSPQERLFGERVVVKEIEIFGNVWHPTVGEDMEGPDGRRSVRRPWRRLSKPVPVNMGETPDCIECSEQGEKGFSGWRDPITWLPMVLWRFPRHDGNPLVRQLDSKRPRQVCRP